jgi:site-specific DNA recombinase
MEAQRAAIYTRVSSDEQVKGYSLDTQEDKLRDYCKLHDCVLDEKHIFREEGVSGAEKNRPMLDKLAECAEKKEIDLVLVYKIDRLSRVLLDLLELTKRLEKNGVGLKSLTEPIDTTNPIGKCIFQILGSFAEFERGVIRERTIEGQIRHKREGNWTSGITPYGYDYSKETKKLSINKKEAEIVKKIFKLFVEDRLNIHRIQTRFNELKIPTKFDNMGKSKGINGIGFWNKRTIGRIIGAEIYTGTFTYRKYKFLNRVKGENNLRPQEEWIAIKTPKIINPEVFNLAQEQLKKNKTYSSKNAKHVFLFSKMIECGLCGCKYSVSYNTSSWPNIIDRRRYTCNAKMNWIRQEGKRCEAKSIVESKIETSVWNEIKRLLTNPALAIEQLEKLYKNQGDEKDVKSEIKELELLIAKAKSKGRRLIDLYLEGTISKEDYKAKSQVFEVQQKRYIDEKEKLSSTLISKKEKESRVDALKQMYAQFMQNLEKITYEQKRELYKMLINKLVIKHSDLEIHCNIPYQNNFVGQSTLRRIRLWDWERFR